MIAIHCLEEQQVVLVQQPSYLFQTNTFTSVKYMMSQENENQKIMNEKERELKTCMHTTSYV